MIRIAFSRQTFEKFQTCPLDELEGEISRTSIRLKLQDQTSIAANRERYQQELDRLSVIKYISQMRRGKLNREDFNMKVELVTP
ncbi:hypothetical protein LX99_02469 [Mucilaginibacter oryzae]|uniref:Uncharacterized protein n=1 Tax=Mucilaginibacter oryzae TaxID=468058 RepID=A0A316HRR4_9SPHI|nr:hypothetical protein [Mucilaginibacter oryzae]PWK77592.1 hypothetical protein LX99_02469 [Mucilaginibacter oryzae]